MERFSYRESVLLGYSPKNAFRDRSNSLESPYEDLEIDFDDVFGGPPRRSSAHETRFSFTEPTDNSAFTDDDEEVNSRGSWKGISEKPVFGDEGSHRRRHANDNFFRDIFKGKESYPTSSTSSSRVLSPVRPFSPRAEPSGSPLPAQFSLPARLTKGVELPTFGSTLDGRHKSKDNASDVTNYCSSSPQSGSSSPNQGKKKNDARTSYRQSLLSRETSLSSNVSSNLTKNDETKKSNSSEAPKNGNQFHFSIYKWASNGVPLVMPLRGGNGSRLKENSNSIPGRSSKSNLGKSIVGYRKPTNGPLSTSRQDDEQGEIVDHADVFSPIPGEETKTSSSSEAGLHGKLEGKVSVTTEQAQKPEVKPLCSLFYDYDYEPPAPGSEKIRKKSSGKGGTARSSKKSSVAQDSSKNLKKQDEKRNHLDRAEAGKDGPKGSALNTGDPGKIRTKGKVKDFVKIFNEETLPNPKTGSATRSQSSRRKERHGLKGEKEVNVNRKGTEEKVSVRNGHENRSTTDPSVMGHENLQHKERQQPDMKKAPEPSGSKETVGGRRESLQDFVVKDITPAENDQPQADNNLEETQAIDAKIRTWSNGKEGNIRSLLSTLQYVLWPGSGWKPVPLVNIIDGSAVKKSYQRALLCLHPDKLQQKGASSSQKYIADKVFDILQDAWDHFNSLGSL